MTRSAKVAAIAVWHASATPEEHRQVEARQRADRIRQGLNAYAALREDIAAAYHARDWESLEYSSWDEYVAKEFGTARLSLPRDERQQVVAYFRGQGMSTRAIASATGAARNTVKEDLRQVGQIDPPEPGAVVVGVDGKTYFPRPEPDVVGAELVDEELPIPAQQQPKPRRRPITEQAVDAGWEIRKAAERIVRILKDDRYERNREEVKQALFGHCDAVQDVLYEVLDCLQNTHTPDGANRCEHHPHPEWDEVAE